MPDTTYDLQGVRVLALDVEGPTLYTERDAVDLIGEMPRSGAQLAVIPTARLDSEFFRLRSSIAGTRPRNLYSTGGAWRLSATSRPMGTLVPRRATSYTNRIVAIESGCWPTGRRWKHVSSERCSN